MRTKVPTRGKVSQLTVVIAIVWLWSATSAAEQKSSIYPFPLIGPYAVKMTDPESPDRQYDLIDASGFGDSGIILVTRITQVAVSGKQIFGTQVKGYFIFDTSRHRIEPQTFSDEGSWKAALSDADVPPTIQWMDLNSMAAKLTDRQLHPSAYRMMGGRFGLSDDVWSGCIQWAGLIFMFARGLFTRSRSSTLAVAILLGLFINVIAGLIIAGGGPSAFVGFFFTPVLYYVAGMAGQLLRKLFWERQGKLV